MASELPENNGRGKLNRAQVHEILARNLKLYRNEPSFIEYMVDLAIYLLEHEYDWNSSDAEAPHADDEAAAAAAAAAEEKVFERKGYNVCMPELNSVNKTPPSLKNCPTCGRVIDDETICPQCRNLIH